MPAYLLQQIERTQEEYEKLGTPAAHVFTSMVRGASNQRGMYFKRKCVFPAGAGCLDAGISS